MIRMRSDMLRVFGKYQPFVKQLRLLGSPRAKVKKRSFEILSVFIRIARDGCIRITGNKTLILSRGFEIGAHSFDECVREFAFDAAAAANLVRTLCVMGQIGESLARKCIV